MLQHQWKTKKNTHSQKAWPEVCVSLSVCVSERRINVGQAMESWTVLRLIEWNTIPSVFNFVFFSFLFVSFLFSDCFFSLAQSKFNCTCYWWYPTSLICGDLAIIGFSLSCIILSHRSPCIKREGQNELANGCQRARSVKFHRRNVRFHRTQTEHQQRERARPQWVNSMSTCPRKWESIGLYH